MKQPRGNLEAVRNFWDRASCGEELYLRAHEGRPDYEGQARERYRLEPFIREFAGFEKSAGREVLEIGVGLGADHEQFAREGALLTGVDLTPRAIEHTGARLQSAGLHSRLMVANAEELPFHDQCFDLVYSWGVIHHSPNPGRVVDEIFRVLKPGGQLRVMIYHRNSIVGLILWVRYALLRGRPLMTLDEIYANYLSPGTRAFSLQQARQLFANFRALNLRVQLTHGDLLASHAGQRHKGPLLSLARKVWPRWLITRCFAGNGLFLLVSGTR